jgi:60 kDa SS-A/Ro ribonucleoprotein
MPNSYLTGLTDNPQATPQSQPIPGREQDMQKNDAGGYVFQTDIWTALQRFLILGTEGGTYYANAKDHTTRAVKSAAACLKADGLRTVRIVTEVSQAGRAPKNDPAILVLAMASIQGDEATRKAALDSLHLVCRTGTHLFTFAELREALGGGWGRGVQRAVGEWYTEDHFEHKMRLPDGTVLERGDKGHHEAALAYQLIKYRQRGGWSHRDLLRLSKPATDYIMDVPGRATIRWAVGKDQPKEWDGLLPRQIQGFELAQAAETPQDTARLVTEYNLPREALKTEHLNDSDVWAAMLDAGMPMTALVRNLATMTRNGLLVAGSNYTTQVIGQIGDAEAIKKSRIHPVQLFMALKTYASGHGQRGGNSWVPVPQIIDALDDAFYMAFENVEATGKRRMIALDISGSMWGGEVAGINGFTPAQAAGVMSMVTLKTGDPAEVVCFTSGGGGYYGYGHGRSRDKTPGELIPGLSALGLSAKQRLDDVDRTMKQMSRYMGGTDASLPVEWAIKMNRKIDVFEVYTDNETWAGSRQPVQALREYRQKSGINAKLVSVGFTATNSSIADPSDSGMMDVVGFDTAAPQLIQAFVEGQV